MVPVTPGNPATLWQTLGKPANAFSKFLRRVGISKTHAGKLKPATEEMDVSVIEPGKNQLFPGIDGASAWPGEFHDVFVRAHRHNAVAQNGHRLSEGLAWLHRMNVCVDNNQVRLEFFGAGVGVNVNKHQTNYQQKVDD